MASGPARRTWQQSAIVYGCMNYVACAHGGARGILPRAMHKYGLSAVCAPGITATVQPSTFSPLDDVRSLPL